MKITFLAHNIYGIGGTVRTVINLAEALAARHEVEIVSVYRRLDEPMFDIAPAVRVTPLLDMRPEPDGVDRNHPLHAERSRLVPPSEEFFRQYSALSDERIVELLRRTDADVIIGTRPSLNLLVAEYAPERAVRIAQEHMTHTAVPRGTRTAMSRLYSRIDAAVTVTEADAASFRATTPVPGLRLLSIPNSVPAPSVAPADGSSRVIVAAGRLDPVKRYDLLVHAFAKVLAEAPDWQLRIYGTGREYSGLKWLIQQLGLYHHVTLMGSASPLEAEWVKGSIAAITSDRESFGMTVVEAMRCGVPVVSTACPDGPPEIIRHGTDGLLVPVGDIDGIAGGLLELVRDQEKRTLMGRAALENSRRYDPDVVAGQYEDLIAEICEQRGLPPLGATERRAAADRSGRSAGAVVTAALAASQEGTRQQARGRVRGLLGRVVRTSRSQATATQPAPAASVRLGSGRPVGGCVAEGSGAVTVTVDWPGFEDAEAKLVCRARTDRKIKVRTPLKPSRDGRWEASLPTGSEKLTEGRWDLFVESGGKLHRLRAGVRDLRRLVHSEEHATRLPVRRHVPYATLDGFLAVRSWVRDRHAEATTIQVLDTGVHLEGRLIAEPFGAGPPVLTVRRRQEPVAELQVEGASSGGEDFRFVLPVDDMVAARVHPHEDWDLWVGPAGSPDGGARLARVLTDMADLKGLQVYPNFVWRDDTPPELAHDSPVGDVKVRPYVAQTNEISVNVIDRV